MEQNFNVAMGQIQNETPEAMFQLPGTQPVAQDQQAAEPTFGSLMQTQPGQPDLSKQVIRQLEQLQIDPSGLSFSPMGTFQLRSRLEKQFGAEYMTVPGVSDVLNMFDQYLNQNKNEAKYAGYAGYAQSQRSLNALLGKKK